MQLDRLRLPLVFAFFLGFLFAGCSGSSGSDNSWRNFEFDTQTGNLSLLGVDLGDRGAVAYIGREFEVSVEIFSEEDIAHVPVAIFAVSPNKQELSPDWNKFLGGGVVEFVQAGSHSYALTFHARDDFALPDGEYLLHGKIDPFEEIEEGDETDNYTVAAGARAAAVVVSRDLLGVPFLEVLGLSTAEPVIILGADESRGGSLPHIDGDIDFRLWGTDLEVLDLSFCVQYLANNCQMVQVSSHQDGSPTNSIRLSELNNSDEFTVGFDLWLSDAMVDEILANASLDGVDLTVRAFFNTVNGEELLIDGAMMTVVAYPPLHVLNPAVEAVNTRSFQTNSEGGSRSYNWQGSYYGAAYSMGGNTGTAGTDSNPEAYTNFNSSNPVTVFGQGSNLFEIQSDGRLIITAMNSSTGRYTLRMLGNVGAFTSQQLNSPIMIDRFFTIGKEAGGQVKVGPFRVSVKGSAGLMLGATITIEREGPTLRTLAGPYAEVGARGEASAAFGVRVGVEGRLSLLRNTVGLRLSITPVIEENVLATTTSLDITNKIWGPHGSLSIFARAAFVRASFTIARFSTAERTDVLKRLGSVRWVTQLGNNRRVAETQ